MTSILLLVAGVFILVLIFAKPFLGLALMLASLALFSFTDVQGVSFTSVTALLGVVTFGATLVQYGKLKNNNLEPILVKKNTKVIIYSVFFLIIIFIGEFIRPDHIWVPRYWPLTYFQLIVLLWLTYTLIPSKKELEIIMVVFIISNLIVSIIGLSGFGGMSSSNDLLLRYSGFTGNANTTSYLLGASFLMLLYFARIATSNFIRVIIYLLIIFLGLATIFTGSRGGILFLILAVGYWGMRNGNRYLLIPIILLLGVSQFIPATYIDRIINIPHDILTQSDSVATRYSLWESAIRAWSQNPIFGIGNGAFVSFAGRDIGYFLIAHNMYLTFLSENGIVGLLSFLLILIQTIINYEKSIRLNSPNLKQLFVTWESILLYFMMFGTKGNLGPNKILWFAIGVSMVALRLMHDMNKNNTYEASKESFVLKKGY
jgi:O-antigen ligase